jgi:hypothetical protein
MCQGYIPKNAEVHLMIGNQNHCKDAAVQAAKTAKADLSGTAPKAVFIIENMSRLKILSRQAVDELKQIRDVFGEQVPLIGMYSQGEIAPIETRDGVKKPYHQNDNVVVIAIG